MTDPITIILPIYKGQELTEKCLESIHKNTRYPYKIIVIADYSEAKIQEEIEGEVSDYNYLFDWQFLDLDFIIRKERKGVISAYNLGMIISKGDVCLIQNDVEFPALEGDCWLTRLVKEIKEDTGAVVCANSGNNHFLGTWCCLIPRQTIKKIGYFDERFGMAMMDDVDYAKRIMLNGLKIIQHKSFSVEHIGSATLRMLDDQKLKDFAAKQYEEKWKDFYDGRREIDIESVDISKYSQEEKEKYNFRR